MIRAYYNEFDPKAAAWLRQLIKNGNITPGVVDERSITEVKPGDLEGFDRIHFFAGVGTWDYCLNGSGWGDRPIWTASLPCQPFSAAGKGLGKADERHLLPHFLELVKKCNPETIFGEQVASSEVVGSELEAAFIVAVQQGDFSKANKLAKRLIAQKGFTFSSRWIDDLCAEMEACDYAIGSAVIGAHSIGAPHIRQRLYWVANSNYERSQRRTRAECSDQQLVGKNGVVDWMANTDTTGKPEQGHRQPLEERLSDGFGRSCEDGLEWIYCRDNKYRPIKPGIQPLVNGITGRVVYSCDPSEPINANATQEARAMRLKGYGNAIQAQTAIAFITAFMGA